MSIISKIQKLRAMAESATIMAEAEAFAMKAQELCFQYNITELELEASKPIPGASAFTKVKIQLGAPTNHLITWRRNLAQAVAQANFGNIVIIRKQSYAYVIAEDRNQKIIQLTFNILCASITNICAFHWSRYYGSENKTSWTNGFFNGAADALATRLERQRARQLTDLTQTRYALVKTNQEVLNKSMRDFFPNLRMRVPTNYRVSKNGYHQGRVEGAKIEIPNPKMQDRLQKST